MSNKYDGLLDKFITEAAERKAKLKFHFSNYWGHWSRTLVSPNIRPELMNNGSVGFEYIELNLTAINGERGDWETEVEPIVFRSHCTIPNYKDKDTEELPADVLDMMKAKLGEELTETLLNDDFLSEIDLNKLRSKMTGGGVCFEDIKKDEETVAEEEANE